MLGRLVSGGGLSREDLVKAHAVAADPLGRLAKRGSHGRDGCLALDRELLGDKSAPLASRVDPSDEVATGE